MHPFEKQMLTVVRQKAIGTDTSYEPPLRIGFGISDKTVGDVANATMGRTILVPGVKQREKSIKDRCHPESTSQLPRLGSTSLIRL